MPDYLEGSPLGERIREAREYLDLSRSELAEMIGLNESRLIEIENGDYVPEATLLPVFSKALGRGIAYFLGDVDAKAAAERTEFLARAAEDLSDDDMGELQRFATYLKSRSEDAHA